MKKILDPGEKLFNLQQEINRHNELYYQKSQPEISDAQYDELVKKKEKLLQENPQLQDNSQIGVEPNEKFAKIEHFSPMLSLQNIFNTDDLNNFFKKVDNFLKINNAKELDLICEPKIDGVSLSLHFENGRLIRGVTRGNGKIGEDVTHNMVHVVPNTLNDQNPPKLVEIRGEIFIAKEDFLELNQQKQFSNPRNLASGILRLLEINQEKNSKLKFIAYGIGHIKDKNFVYHRQMLQQLQNWELNTIEFAKCQGNDDILQYYEKIYSRRAEIPYDIDGTVYKIDDLNLQKKLSFAGKFPRWAVAHKFPAKQGKTRIQKIALQVGRSGVITPIAQLEPITIGGVVIKKASLHNFDLLQKKDIREGDMVLVQRAGDVIPYIAEVDLEKRPVDSQKFALPKKCPICNAELIKEKAALLCPNEWECSAQMIGKLIHFVSKDAFDIRGMGKKQIEFLFNKTIILNYEDIFLLHEKKSILEKAPGWGKKSVEKLLHEIEIKKSITLDKFLFSLGIQHLGLENAKIIADHSQTIESIINNENLNAELNNLHGIGEKTINNLIKFTKNNIEKITVLLTKIHIKTII